MAIDLSQQQLDRLEQCVEDLGSQCGADLVVLADESGQTIAAWGQTRSGDFSTLAALAAANLAATVAIAGQVGERGSCRTMLYEGENKRIYIAAAPQELVMLIVTGNHVPIGAVRFFLHQAGYTIQEILRSSTARRKTEELLPPNLDLDVGFEELFSGLDTLEGPPNDQE